MGVSRCGDVRDRVLMDSMEGNGKGVRKESGGESNSEDGERVDSRV